MVRPVAPVLVPAVAVLVMVVTLVRGVVVRAVIVLVAVLVTPVRISPRRGFSAPYFATQPRADLGCSFLSHQHTDLQQFSACARRERALCSFLSARERGADLLLCRRSPAHALSHPTGTVSPRRAFDDLGAARGFSAIESREKSASTALFRAPGGFPNGRGASGFRLDAMVFAKIKHLNLCELGIPWVGRGASHGRQYSGDRGVFRGNFHGKRHGKPRVLSRRGSHGLPGHPLPRKRTRAVSERIESVGGFPNRLISASSFTLREWGRRGWVFATIFASAWLRRWSWAGCRAIRRPRILK